LPLVTVPGEGAKLLLPGELPVVTEPLAEPLLGVARPPLAERSRSRRF
jgi:hypothetical protein